MKYVKTYISKSVKKIETITCQKVLRYTAKNNVTGSNSCRGNFVERHSFRIVSSDLRKTMRKLCLSPKFLTVFFALIYLALGLKLVLFMPKCNFFFGLKKSLFKCYGFLVAIDAFLRDFR